MSVHPHQNVRTHSSKIKVSSWSYHIWGRVVSISSPQSYPVVAPMGGPFLGDKREGAWSLTWDPHFHSPPFALHSHPSLYGIWSHVGLMPEYFSGAGKRTMEIQVKNVQVFSQHCNIDVVFRCKQSLGTYPTYHVKLVTSKRTITLHNLVPTGVT